MMKYLKNQLAVILWITLIVQVLISCNGNEGLNQPVRIQTGLIAKNGHTAYAILPQNGHWFLVLQY